LALPCTARFPRLKTTGELSEAAQQFARKLWMPTMVILVVSVVATYIFTDCCCGWGSIPAIPIGAPLAMLVAGYFIYTNRSGWAFIMTAVAIIFATSTMFLVLFPRVMVSSLNPAWSLTIYNASSSPYTLQYHVDHRPGISALCSRLPGLGLLDFPQTPDR
jgi:cytochrome bd ubiquinol oxidase subunit II